jgi:phenylpropionate dioxygenase-like ring-hydroxylating dioxygenase large terminal subunit
VFTTISDEAPSFQEYFPGLEEVLNQYDFTERPYRRKLDYIGRFNWKTMMDGFQECLHCQFAHPGLSKLYPPSFYKVVSHQHWSQHFSNPKSDDDGLFLFFFPASTLNLYNGGMSTFRTCPTEKPGASRMEFHYYYEATGEQFEEYYKFVREVADEDTHLCELTQANLEKGIYTEGCLNPVNESGVIGKVLYLHPKNGRLLTRKKTTNRRYLTWSWPSIPRRRSSRIG